MKVYRYRCVACGSTNVEYSRRNGKVIVLARNPGCKDCGSKDITYFLVNCDECGVYSLFFDDVRCEIVCTNCGLVHAGTTYNTDYPLGFLVKRPNLRF